MAVKEFDKDYIFNLIMPSTAEEPENTAAAANAPEAPHAHSGEADKAAPDGAGTVEQSPATGPQSDIAELKARLFLKPDTGVQIAPQRSLSLVNLMEQLVVERMDAAFEKFNCCKCDKCKKDVAAHALNSLPAHYVLTDGSDIETLMASCDTKAASTAVIKAILHVKNNPKH